MYMYYKIDIVVKWITMNLMNKYIFDTFSITWINTGFSCTHSVLIKMQWKLNLSAVKRLEVWDIRNYCLYIWKPHIFCFVFSIAILTIKRLRDKAPICWQCSYKNLCKAQFPLEFDVWCFVKLNEKVRFYYQ